MMQLTMSLRRKALDILALSDPSEKLCALQEADLLECETGTEEDLLAGSDKQGICLPGRPPRPVLVSPRVVEHRSVHTPEGRAILIHALCHIEFNAINLALDITWRFAGLPPGFYQDWMRVAQEEALHFALLHNHLKQSGYAYGDFSAHNGLWDMAQKTQGQLIARLALVPRILEARGLDVTPALRHKLFSAGDKKGAAILDIILRDEIGHVRIGNHWYRWACEREGLDPLQTASQLAHDYDAPALRGPFNLPARRQAGFDEIELLQMQQTLSSYI
jgi:uncharacterized ferritin-like protein (DUF455 family)